MLLLRRGQRDIAVAEIRARLARMGFQVDSLDEEFFDDKLDGAVRTFQQARGLNPDGIVGPLTLARIEEAHWSLGDRVLQFIPGQLMRGEDVVTLQQRLTTLGFDLGNVDGVFGVRTDAALREFQMSVGIEADGVAAGETYKAFERLARTITGGRSEKLRQAVILDSIRTGIAGKTIVIDPGHGGSDTGVSGFGIFEANVVSAIAHKLQGKLSALGASVALTRPLIHSTNPTDNERAQLCNDINADFVISLHCDVATSVDASGIAIFHFGSELGGWSHSGQRAAQRVHAAVLAHTDAADCKVHARTWEILRLTRMPAIRVEVGYLSNQVEAERLTHARYQDELAQGISEGIQTFFAPSTT
jgi:N-acetylmuramoyl-L-alanine amidase